MVKYQLERQRLSCGLSKSQEPNKNSKCGSRKSDNEESQLPYNGVEI